METAASNVSACSIRTGANASIWQIKPSGDGGYYVVGQFTAFNGVPARGLAKLKLNTGSTLLQILNQPQSVTAAIGATVSFSVAAKGSGALTFKWKKGSEELPGQTSPSLVLGGIQAENAGIYSVEVRDGSGMVQSQSAQLTIQGAGQTFSQWLADKGLTASVNDGPGHDPDNDQLPNIGEFAFGSHPNQANSNHRPMAFTVNDGGTLYPAVRYQRNKLATGVTIVITAATDVGFGSPLATTVMPPVDLGSNLEQITVRANTALSGVSKVFFRVQVSQP